MVTNKDLSDSQSRERMKPSRSNVAEAMQAVRLYEFANRSRAKPTSQARSKPYYQPQQVVRPNTTLRKTEWLAGFGAWLASVTFLMAILYGFLNFNSVWNTVEKWANEGLSVPATDKVPSGKSASQKYRNTEKDDGRTIDPPPDSTRPRKNRD